MANSAIFRGTKGYLTAAAIAGTALLAALQLRYAHIVCQPPPHQDDWTFLSMFFDAMHNGRLWVWFFQPYNGHMLVPAGFAFWFDFRFLHLNLSWVRWLCSLISCIAVTLWFLWLSRNRTGLESIAGPLIGGALVIFSLSYWEYFSLAIGFSAYLSALLAAVGFAQLASLSNNGRPRVRNSAIALVCLIGSALTYGSGYAALAAGVCWWLLLIFGWRPGGKLRVSSGLIWLVPSALGLLLLCSNPHLVAWRWPSGELFYRFSLAVGAAAASLVTTNETLREQVAFVSGLCLACLGLGQLLAIPNRKPGEADSVFGTGLVVCGLVTCLAVAYSRMFIPAVQMLSSRYSMHFALGLLGLLLCLRRQTIVFPILLLGLAAMVLVVSLHEWQTAPFRRLAYNHVRELERTLPSISDDEIRKAFFWDGVGEIRSVTHEMEEAELGEFRKGTTR